MGNLAIYSQKGLSGAEHGCTGSDVLGPGRVHRDRGECYGQEQAGVLRALRIEATKQLIFKEPGMDLYVCPRQLVLRPGRLGSAMREAGLFEQVLGALVGAGRGP
jgi:hypothetical protein